MTKWYNLFPYNDFWHSVDKEITNKKERRIFLRGCWRWIGSQTKWGYPYYYLNRRKYYAHRVSATSCGDIDDKQIHHRCGNKWCVNPHHLDPLSFSEHLWEHNYGVRKQGGYVSARAKFYKGEFLIRQLNAKEKSEPDSDPGPFGPGDIC